LSKWPGERGIGFLPLHSTAQPQKPHFSRQTRKIARLY